jgi:hypothetical protein
MMTCSNIDTLIARRNALIASRRDVQIPLWELDDARFGLGKFGPVEAKRYAELDADDDRLFNAIEDLNDAIWAAPMTCWRHLAEKISILKHWVRLGIEVDEPVAALWEQIRGRERALAPV